MPVHHNPVNVSLALNLGIGGGPAPAVTFVGYQGYTGSGGNLNASAPAGTQTGDMILVVVTNATSSDNPPTPSGWTLGPTGSQSGTRARFYYRRRQAGDSTYAWNSMPGEYAVASASYRSVGDVTFGTPANGSATAPALIAPTAGKFVYMGGSTADGNPVFSNFPGGWSQRGETNRWWPASTIGDRTLAATASENSGAVAVSAIGAVISVLVHLEGESV